MRPNFIFKWKLRFSCNPITRRFGNAKYNVNLEWPFQGESFSDVSLALKPTGDFLFFFYIFHFVFLNNLQIGSLVKAVEDNCSLVKSGGFVGFGFFSLVC